MAQMTQRLQLQVQRLRAACATAGRRIRSASADGRLQGRTLAFARGAWLSLAALTVVLYLAGVGADIARQVRGRCPLRMCVQGQVPLAVQRAFSGIHLSVSFYGWYTLGLNVFFAIGFTAVAALLFSRRSDDLLALFVSLALLMFGVGSFENGFLAAGLPAVSPGWRLPVALLGFLGEMAFGIFVAVFPDGRFVPRWTRLAVPAALTLWWLPTIFLPGSPLDFTTWPVVAYFCGWAAMLGMMGGGQVYRYRYVSTPGQRLQTKWVVYGFVAAAIGYFAGRLVVALAPPPLTTPDAVLADFAGNALSYVSFLLLPLCIGIAMLRSHLFDIDVLIRRTLVYSSLTALLAVVYVSCVVGTQVIVQTVGGRQPLPPVVIVGSTLLIAALFQPLRQLLKRDIDRRFYRSRYEAKRTLATFAGVVRSEVDLATLEGHLLGVVNETMQPTQVSLWLVRPLPQSKSVPPVGLIAKAPTRRERTDVER
jgi:hypothetical protein